MVARRDRPKFTQQEFRVDENTNCSDFSATNYSFDRNGGALTYAITGGRDADLFDIGPIKGALRQKRCGIRGCLL